MANVQLADQGGIIKAAYEGQTDTNAFTDAEKAKLAGVGTGAQRVATGTVTPYAGDLDFTGGVGGAGAWGGITGTLADQTDLQAALDGKATAAQGAKADSALQPAALNPTFTALTVSRDTTSADNGADVESSAATAVTLTVVAGTITRGMTITQDGAGAVTIAAGAGVTITTEADVQAVTNGQYAVAFLKPTSTVDVFRLTGSLAAV